MIYIVVEELRGEKLGGGEVVVVVVRRT